MAANEAIDRDAEALLEDINTDAYVRIKSDLVIIGDSIMTDRHHASADNYEADDPPNQIGFDLFGGFGGIPGKVMRRPIQFSPVRSSVEYTRGQAEGHYRQINRNVVSRNEEDNRTPLRNTKYDAVANLDGCWHLSFRELKPEFVGLLDVALEFLDSHQTDFMHQLGGARNFGAGIVDTGLINPLYDESELRRVFDRGKRSTNAMDDKDEQWAQTYQPAFRAALADRIDG